MTQLFYVNKAIFFQTGNKYDGVYDESKFVDRPIMTVSLKISDGKLVFHPTLDDTRACLQRCLNSIIEASHHFPRIEKLLFPGLQ